MTFSKLYESSRSYRWEGSEEQGNPERLSPDPVIWVHFHPVEAHDPEKYDELWLDLGGEG